MTRGLGTACDGDRDRDVAAREQARAIGGARARREVARVVERAVRSERVGEAAAQRDRQLAAQLIGVAIAALRVRTERALERADEAREVGRVNAGGEHAVRPRQLDDAAELVAQLRARLAERREPRA